MKVVFLLGSPDIGGGTYVIYQHALKCLDNNMDVTIVTNEKVTKKRISWHKDAKRLKFKNYKDIENESFDLAIATWWRTVYELPKVNAKNYLYFVQSIESRFVEGNDWVLKRFIDATYTLPMPIITEATWIKEYLEEKYGANVTLVKNGIRKDIYKLEGDKYSKDEAKLRVLVEGPVDVFFKNVPKTIDLVKNSQADEIWLLTSSDIDKYPGVDRVFSKQTIEECAKIYRSCDVLVKLSLVEGMFGPPLEMFHCGGTAITYKVSGWDEYIKNNYNALVADMNDEEKVGELIDELYNDRELLSKLKENAIRTADNWINWDESSDLFYKSLLKLQKVSYDKNLLLKTIEFNLDSYDLYYINNSSFRRRVGNVLRKHFPIVYKIYQKIFKGGI